MASLQADGRTASAFRTTGEGILARIRASFARLGSTADTGCITDLATLRELSRLTDHELLDVGVVRRKCGTKWRLIGREVALPIASYEYFWIGAEAFPPS